MADDFQKKFDSLAGKLKIDPKKDGDLKKALAEVSSAVKKEADDFDKTIKSFVATVGKKIKDASDKDEKKKLTELQSLAQDDIDKRYAFKDTSTKPS